MTRLLKQAFREISKLSPEEQDSVASILLAELESDRAWARAFSESQDLLEKLGRDALTEYSQGEAEELDPSTL